jgi:flagellar biosynthetic protein FliQ
VTNPADLIEVAREGLILALLLSLPILGAALIAGLLTALLQMVTKVSEPVLTYVPRIVAVVLAVIFVGPWMGGRLANFAERIWSMIQVVGN